MKRPVSGSGVAPAIGPYSAAIASGDLLFCSGQLGMDPETGALREGVAAQAEQALVNLRALLSAAGFGVGIHPAIQGRHWPDWHQRGGRRRHLARLRHA